MKLANDNRRLSFMSLFLATVLVAGIHAPKVHAQDDMLDDADGALSGDALQMDDINLEGKLSPSERLRQRREKLEERNKLMVEKKIEDIRVKQEIQLTNKLQDAFGKSLNNLNEDKVQVAQAAPVAPQPVVAAPAPVVETPVVEAATPVFEETVTDPTAAIEPVKPTQEELEEKVIERWYNEQNQPSEVNHFELANSSAGVNMTKFSSYEAIVGKFKFKRSSAADNWKITVDETK